MSSEPPAVPDEESDLAPEGEGEIPMEDMLRAVRRAGTGAEPVALDPELEAELERRSAEVRELDRQGLLTSAEEHLRKLRARSEHRRVG